MIRIFTQDTNSMPWLKPIFDRTSQVRRNNYMGFLKRFFCKKIFFPLKTPYTQSKLRIITKELKESPENGYRDVRFFPYSTQTFFVEMSLFFKKGFAGSLRHEGYHHHHRLHQGDTQRGAQAGAAGENTCFSVNFPQK